MEKFNISELILFLTRQKYDIEYINVQNNSINGIVYYNDKKLFFKFLNELQFFNELRGYVVSLDKIPIMKIRKMQKLNNKYIMFFDYDFTIRSNYGLLNDFFVKNEFNKIVFSKNRILKKVLRIYDKNFKTKIRQYDYPMNKFFKGRIYSRLIKWYENDCIFDKKIKLNGNKSITTREIIKETQEYFVNQKLEVCVFTQGDPNTLNISISPCLFDLETAGYNSVMGEFSTMLISTLIYDNYFCPKYHPSSYHNHEIAIKNLNKFKPKIDVKYSDDSIIINICIKTSKIRKEYIMKYIRILKKNNIKIEDSIRYFIVMRLLCVFDIRTMDKDDYFYSFYLVHYFYMHTNNINYKKLKKMVKSYN